MLLGLVDIVWFVFTIGSLDSAVKMDDVNQLYFQAFRCPALHIFGSSETGLSITFLFFWQRRRRWEEGVDSRGMELRNLF